MPYAPLNLDAIMSQYRDKKKPPAWFGMDVWGATVCFNTVEAQEEEHPEARDLEGPDQAGLQGPDRDAESGVVGHRLLRRHRLADAVGRRQRQGRRLEVHGRAAREHRAVHALRLASRATWPRAGEYVVGISFEYRGNANKAKGAPIDLVFPEGRPGLGPGGLRASTRARRRLDAAQKLADWASSKDAMLLYGKNFAITAQPGVAAPLANVPQGLRGAPGEDGLRLGRRQPRAHPGRVDQALQRQVRAEEVSPRPR